MAELAKASESLTGQPIANLRLGPPLPDPQKIICIGLNYHDHAKEVGATPPPSPIFFAKFANSLVGPTDDLIPPRDETHVDYEAELAVVIGKAGRYISSENALAHVAGAMAFNDVSARDFQLANQLWTSGKAVDTFGPCGPALVTVDDLGDLQDLSVKTRVNGDTVQNGTTASMIFPIADLIEFLTRVMTLEPGDIIATGTPAGVARAHKPPRFLKAGDVVEVEIQGIGTLKNTVLEAE
jgi:2-keto-4-pentenoate hydratase/2-oxohepta-3-ene-1,7-dioic acid hydratase in catechol pathway